MSAREADRLAVVRKVLAKRLLQREAAERLGVSVRQFKRLRGGPQRWTPFVAQLGNTNKV